MKTGFLGLCVVFPIVGWALGEALLNETFDDQLGQAPSCQRAGQVMVVAGHGAIGEGPVARFFDESEAEGGILEYTVGTAPAGAFCIMFDLLNNAPAETSEKREGIVFSVGLWAKGNKFALQSNSTQAFALDFAQAGAWQSLKFRVGGTTVNSGSYDMEALQKVKIWVNDSDAEPLSYIRPDTKVAAELAPDSFVVWINDVLFGYQSDTGIPMQTSISQGDAVLGRIGFKSLKSDKADFMIDNLRVERVAP